MTSTLMNPVAWKKTQLNKVLLQQLPENKINFPSMEHTSPYRELLSWEGYLRKINLFSCEKEITLYFAIYILHNVVSNPTHYV